MFKNINFYIKSNVCYFTLSYESNKYSHTVINYIHTYFRALVKLKLKKNITLSLEIEIYKN